MGQLLGEVIKVISDDKCIIKVSNGPRYVVSIKP